MRGAAAAKSAFNDPTKGGAVPQGREAAPSVVFSQCKDEKFHPSSRPSGYKQWFRRLRSSFRPSALKDEICDKTLQGVDILVLGAPRAKFSVDEFDALKASLKAQGSIVACSTEPRCFLDTGICSVAFCAETNRWVEVPCELYDVASMARGA